MRFNKAKGIYKCRRCNEVYFTKVTLETKWKTKEEERWQWPFPLLDPHECRTTTNKNELGLGELIGMLKVEDEES